MLSHMVCMHVACFTIVVFSCCIKYQGFYKAHLRTSDSDHFMLCSFMQHDYLARVDNVMLVHQILSYVLSCHVKLCYVKLCYVMQC